MVLWNEITGTPTLPIRFQIPRGYCEYGKNNQYNLVYLNIENKEFLEWFKRLEAKLVQREPLDSRVSLENGTIHVKYVDDFTQIFDEKNTFLFDMDVTMNDCFVDCLVEIDKVYGPMKDTGSYGITCKIFQARIIPNCMFTSDSTFE